MRIVVTMTSWVGRIQYTGESIYRFISSQTVKPDLVYLFLSEEEFPQHYHDLPIDLLKTCYAFGVIIKWCKYNEYVHKRWYVYPQHYDDLVVSIDEDQVFDKNLLKDAVCVCTLQSKPNVSYNIFKQITVDIVPNGGISYKRLPVSSHTPSITTNMNGVHIWPPKTFPLDAISPDNLKVRSRICTRCDESWLLPWLKVREGLVTYLNDKSILDLLPIANNGSTMSKHNSQLVMGVKKRDLQLYIVLRVYPHLMECWKSIYPSYVTENFDKISVDHLLKLL